MKRQNMEKIKQYILKKDNLLIIILTGILLLVIAWPVGGNGKEKSNVSGLWDKNDSKVNTKLIGKNDLSGNGENGSEYTGENMVDEGIQQEEYIVAKLEQRLEEILTSMQGVGRVNVMITLSSSGEEIVEKDIPLERSNIVENDSTGGNRSTNEMYSREETVYITNSAGDKIPYVVKKNSAQVAGVSVVAEGGENPLVQKNISEAIQALFGIEEHKIKVAKMKQVE